MLYSEEQVDRMVGEKIAAAARRAKAEFELLRSLEAEVRKAYTAHGAEDFDSSEVEHILTRIDIVRSGGR